MNQTVPNDPYPFLESGGQMGELIRLYSWKDHALGSPHYWPKSLLSTLAIILGSKFPMFLFWGPEHICFTMTPIGPA